MANQLKKIAIGVSDFEEIVSSNYYYIDKSLFIKEIIDNGSKVILLPRPRRFGKTLNMTMLKAFFEKTNTDSSTLFERLKIWKYEECRQYQGKYPIIWLTFKDIKSDSWDECYEKLKIAISDEFTRHSYLMTSNDLTDFEKHTYKEIMELSSTQAIYENSLKKLSEFLNRYHKQKVIVLMDEYDTPVHSGHSHGYFDKVINFMRSLLGCVLKDNTSMEKGVLTGILRIARESIFSDLNNLDVCTMLNNRYSDKFGLLEHEVEKMLEYYGIECEMNDVRSWYNGYVFGKTTGIYNPWSILNYVRNYDEGLIPYWINTSSNEIVKELITNSGEDLKQELEVLVSGNSIEKEINENIVMTEINNNSSHIWSFLLFSGYLKVSGKRTKGRKFIYSLKIPNEEVAYLYEQIILNWFSRSIEITKYELMLGSLTIGDINIFGKILREYVLSTFSYFDAPGKREPEKIYHSFVLGMLVGLTQTHEVKSNRESGYGRYDVMVIPKNISKKGIIIEFKKVDKDTGETLEKASTNALNQIKTKNYRQELLDRGISDIVELGISFEGKEVMISANN